MGRAADRDVEDAASMEEVPAGGPLRREIGWILQAALFIFTFTVAIGVLNGTDIVDFDYKAVLAHVHSGTLGWLTMSVFAASLWLFSAGRGLSPALSVSARVLAAGAVISIPLYIAAFLTTYGILRPLAGSLVLAEIAGFFLWTALRVRSAALSTVHLGVLAAMATSVMGGIPGVLWGYEIATGAKLLNAGAIDAHPGTMVIGFLVPVGMALTEWAFCWPEPPRASRGGSVQMGLLFAGGALLEVGLITDITALVVLTVPFELAALVIFQRRMWPYLHSIQLDRQRFAAFSAIWTTINLGLFFFLVGRYSDGFEFVPRDEILALDHVMFIGVMTNAVFGVVNAAGEESKRLAWADHYVLAGMNLGLGFFAVGLFGDISELKQAFTPIIGASIVLGLVTYTLRIRDGPRASAVGTPARA